MDVPRLLRPVGTPLAVYFRPGRNDHTSVLQLLAENPRSLAGLVFDPCLEARQGELLGETLGHHLEAVLDPRSTDLSTPGGFVRSGVAELPWAGSAIDTPERLAGSEGDEMITSLGEYVAEKGFTAVQAPTHFLARANDPWLAVDAELTRRLRERLDTLERASTLIYYALGVHANVFRDAPSRARLIASLSTLPIDGIWLRVHPFGSTSGPTAVRRYIEACRDLHRLGLPLVAERTGTIGIALAAFGAVGGIESGITFGEKYDVSPLLREPKGGDAFLPQPRVYLPEIGAFLPREVARAFFENRQMRSAFGCRDGGCCRRGFVDTLADPKRHFMIQRLREVSALSRAPESLRTQLYLDDFLRPATDKALKAARTEPALETMRKRLEAWRQTLGAMSREAPASSFAAPPDGKRVERRKLA
jgi:hypothetical protein